MDKRFHVLTVVILCVLIFMVSFTTENPFILFSVFLINAVIFISNKRVDMLKRGLLYFIPFAITTLIINMLFVWEGKTILFHIGSKRFTLESLIYALILSFKLLIVIYTFMDLEVLIDSDKALSYFSNLIPKSTLTLMISLKLFPNMKQRLFNLKQIYSIRGVSFQEKKLKDKVKSYIPIMSILLEDSLENSFDIGEAAYNRGFLSSKRTVYDKQRLYGKDYILIALCVTAFAGYLFVKFNNMDRYSIYLGLNILSYFNYGVTIVNFILILVSVTFVMLNYKSKEK